MDAKVKEAKVSADGEVEKTKKALRALPDRTRAEVLESALDDLSIIPLLCGLVLFPTAAEQDATTIMQRTRITATIRPSAGTVLNVGEAFEVDVDVRNCTSHYLRDVELVARSTAYARVTGPSVFALGDLDPGERASATIACEAIALTPTQGGPPDPVLNLSAQGALDFRVVKSQPVLTEVFPA